MTQFQPPRSDRLPDTRVLDGLLEYGEARAEVVPVARIFGMNPGANHWNPDWTLRDEDFPDDPELLQQHRKKLARLLTGNLERGRSPIEEPDLAEGLGWKYLTLHLVEIEGLYFVGSGGVHRVAVAQRLGFKLIKAIVTPARFKLGTPEAARDWVTSFRQTDG